MNMRVRWRVGGVPHSNISFLTNTLRSKFADVIPYVNISDTPCMEGKGYRGGRKAVDAKGASCQQTAGDQGESWNGKGDFDFVTAGFSCCGGPSNAPTAYKGRGLANNGGGGGGAGACHGGGGAGGAHGDWSAVPKCPNACGHRGAPGDGSPECSRAGSWSQRGKDSGINTLERLSFGSGGGGGNSHSPSEREDNRGGNGGGAIFLDGGKSVKLNAMVRSNGCQGYPVVGTDLYNQWRSSNPQDGSGGAGAGGSIHVMALEGTATINSNRMIAKGGICGCDNGWRANAQMGAAGAWGRLATTAKKTAGSARKVKITNV